MSEAPLIVQGRKEYKDEQLLARLIGAAVLLAIAVIVLPFVLDGAGSQREYEYAETFPVQPQRPVLEKSYSSRQPLPDTPDKNELPSITAKTPPVGQSVSTVKTENRIAAAQPAPAAVSPVDNAPVPPTTIATGVVYRDVPAGYNIQVASFVKETNALKLYKRMREQDVSAYINRVQGKKRAIFRVFAGPISSQIDALALKNRIDRSYRVDSIMVTRN